jgi:hypothetical protein
MQGDKFKYGIFDLLHYFINATMYPHSLSTTIKTKILGGDQRLPLLIVAVL